MKRMWDKPELVKLIEDNAPEITVDDALSGTSENPVQNKVINTALGTKQDSLPSTTGEEGKFLKVGASGLEWASAGGGKYLHLITCDTFASGQLDIRGVVHIAIVNNSSTVFTASSLKDWLTENNYTGSTFYPAEGTATRVLNNGTMQLIYGRGLSVHSDKLSLYCLIVEVSGTVADSNVSFAETLGSIGANLYLHATSGVSDKVITL